MSHWINPAIMLPRHREIVWIRDGHGQVVLARWLRDCAVTCEEYELLKLDEIDSWARILTPDDWS